MIRTFKHLIRRYWIIDFGLMLLFHFLLSSILDRFDGKEFNLIHQLIDSALFSLIFTTIFRHFRKDMNQKPEDYVSQSLYFKLDQEDQIKDIFSKQGYSIQKIQAPYSYYDYPFTKSDHKFIKETEHYTLVGIPKRMRPLFDGLKPI